jgi:uncharacterized protein involved in outer membrane biogenesis
VKVACKQAPTVLQTLPKLRPTHPTRGGIEKKLLLSLVAFSLVAVAAWIFALPAVLRNRVTAHTGCPVEAGSIKLNPFGGTLRLVDLRLRNPAGFPVPEFVDLALLDVDVDVLSLVGDELRVARVVIDVPKVTIVTGKDGVTNTGVVRQRLDATNGPESDPDKVGTSAEIPHGRVRFSSP